MAVSMLSTTKGGLVSAGNSRSSEIQLAEKAASQAAQAGLSPWFWSSVWTPLVFLWTFYWLLERLLAKRLIQKAIDIVSSRFTNEKIDASKVTALSRGMKVAIVFFDFAWFFIITLFITIVVVLVCHGDGTFLGSAGAWFARTAIRVGTLGSASFDFCKQVPKIN